MSGSKRDKVYLRLRKELTLPSDAPVRLGEVAFILAEPQMESRLRRLELKVPAWNEGKYALVDIFDIVRTIRKEWPEADIEHFGEATTLIRRGGAAAKPRIVLIAFVWILLFIGSGLAIMNFHVDVSMMEVHQQMYRMLTGVKDDHPLVMQIPYSIGIGLGMLLFFNRVFRQKLNEEPNPLELELFTYQESIHQYVVKDEFRKRGRRDPE